MQVLALDPYASPAIAQANNVVLVSSLPELLEKCDFMTIHTPLIASTKGMINTKELRTMKRGARIFNVVRRSVFQYPRFSNETPNLVNFFEC